MSRVDTRYMLHCRHEEWPGGVAWGSGQGEWPGRVAWGSGQGERPGRVARESGLGEWPGDKANTALFFLTGVKGLPEFLHVP